MPIICWGQLAKSADDTTRIEQSIGEYIESHNEDPNAHMGADYALGAHRLAVELDHLPYSIFNKFLYPQSRIYKAVVDQSGNGDDVDIQSAIDYVNGLGGGNILLKSGIYLPGNYLTLYSNVRIIGEDILNTVIDFNNTSYGIRSLTKDNAGITGVSIKNSTGQAITISSNRYSNFGFLNFDNNEFDVVLDGSCIQNIVENIHSTNNQNQGIKINTAAYVNQVNWIRNALIESKGDCGLKISSGYGNFIERVIVNGATNNGIEIDGGNCDYTTLLACEGNDNGMSGLALYTADRLNILNFKCRNNQGDGIYADNMGDCQILGPQCFDNYGYGIELETHPQNNLIDSYCCRFNHVAATVDTGSGNVWGSHIT